MGSNDRRFYTNFHPDVENSSNISKSDIGALRLLGIDPDTGKNIYARLARFGPCVQLGELEDEEKPRYSSLRKDQLIETITLEEALELLKCREKSVNTKTFLSKLILEGMVHMFVTGTSSMG